MREEDKGRKVLLDHEIRYLRSQIPIDLQLF